MRRWIKRITTIAVMVLIVGLSCSWWAVQQTRHIPEFYQRATGTAESGKQSCGEILLETSAKSEFDSSDEPGFASWSAIFTVDEVNAWLAKELPTSFPQLLAQGATDPRICIEDGRVLAAARYKTQRLDLVISCELAVELTEEPNMLALRVKHLRAGALPIPLSSFLTGISKEAAKGDVDIRWDDTHAGPVALVKVPSEHPRYVTSPVLVESVQLVDGALVLSGNTGPLAYQTFRPLGPIYQFVSYRPGENNNDQSARISSQDDSDSTMIR